MKIHFHKANDYETEVPVVLKLIFDIPLPSPPEVEAGETTWNAWHMGRRALVESEAAGIADALFRVCPGSVIDALVVEFLRRQLRLLSDEAK